MTHIGKRVYARMQDCKIARNEGIGRKIRKQLKIITEIFGSLNFFS